MDGPRSGRRIDARTWNLYFGAGLAALALLVIVVVVIASVRPYTNQNATAQDAQTAASPAVSSAAPKVASPAPAPASVATTTPKPQAAAAPKTAKPKPKPAATPPRPKTLPEQMGSLLPGSTQLIAITGDKLGSNSGTLAVFNKDSSGWTQVMSVPAHFGKTGLVNQTDRNTGDLHTPTGIWSLGGSDAFVFGMGSSAPAGTKMPYRHITQSSWWSAVHDDTYNTWVTSSSHVSGEHLADSSVQYKYALNTGFNAPPNDRVIGRGTAIFIHCAEPPGNALGPYTHGCIAIDPTEMVRLFTILDPARNPSCAIGTLVKGSGTSIWAY